MSPVPAIIGRRYGSGLVEKISFLAEKAKENDDDSVLSLYLRLFEKWIVSLEPVDHWLSEQKIVSFEKISVLVLGKRLSQDTTYPVEDWIDCFGHFCFSSSSILSRTGSLFYLMLEQLKRKNVCPSVCRSWLLRYQDVIHCRRPFSYDNRGAAERFFFRDENDHSQVQVKGINDGQKMHVDDDMPSPLVDNASAPSSDTTVGTGESHDKLQSDMDANAEHAIGSNDDNVAIDQDSGVKGSDMLAPGESTGAHAEGNRDDFSSEELVMSLVESETD